MARCIFHIDLDAFFVSVEQALNPALKGKPVIVGGDPERRGVVASASYEARPFGIYAGMPLSKARRLCPQAIFLRANFSRYRDASNRFMEILAAFSPDIEPLGLDEAYLDVTGYAEPYGSPRKLARAIKERINKELKLTASVGIGTCKVVAKIASALCKPDGLLEIAPGEERTFLNPLPIAKLPGVGENTEQSLKEMGITTIGELASLPLDTITRRFGATGAVIHSYARGIDDREVEAPGEAKSISQQLTFARDTLDHNFLEANLHNLCQEVCHELRSQNKRAKCVAIRLRYADFKTITRQVTLKEASDVTQVIFATAQQLLSKTLAKQEKPIRLIGIRISGLVGEEKQLPMFDSRVAKLGHLDQAVDKIRKKYGPTAIKTGNDIFSESS
ncbi:MAG: DNA polymerase IV [Dehalococcoidia bacterium]|nr:DNA polymerase IV [Dehalococcoidia bacterium]